jgi:phosphoglycolate phosphatase
MRQAKQVELKMRRFDGVLFDKDGTLFDFHATWSAWTAALLVELAAGEPLRVAELAAAIDFDLELMRLRPGSAVISGTPGDITRLLLPWVPGPPTEAELLSRLNGLAAGARQVETVPLRAYMALLQGAGLQLGVATNDAEAPARTHLASAGIEADFHFIAGYDSGYGAKPAPGMCLAFAEGQGLEPARCVMVGDSRHDLEAGRRAGMATVAVLTGVAERAELAPLADVVLADISHLPAWLGI